MVMSLSLIDDGDDIFNHMLYSGSIRTLSLISGTQNEVLVQPKPTV